MAFSLFLLSCSHSVSCIDSLHQIIFLLLLFPKHILQIQRKVASALYNLNPICLKNIYLFSIFKLLFLTRWLLLCATYMQFVFKVEIR